jgi:hypothetical protein
VFFTELSSFFSAMIIVLGLQQIADADDLTGVQHPSKLLNSFPILSQTLRQLNPARASPSHASTSHCLCPSLQVCIKQRCTDCYFFLRGSLFVIGGGELRLLGTTVLIVYSYSVAPASAVTRIQ